jgi:uncharacterized protein YlxP (DUF503 family)
LLIAAALIELRLHESESIKAKRRVVNSVKDRVRRRYNVSVAEVAEQDDRHEICIGCVAVGIDPRHLRAKLEKVVGFVDSLGLAELVSDDLTIVRIDELEEIEEVDEAEEVPGS